MTQQFQGETDDSPLDFVHYFQTTPYQLIWDFDDCGLEDSQSHGHKEEIYMFLLAFLEHLLMTLDTLSNAQETTEERIFCSLDSTSLGNRWFIQHQEVDTKFHQA